MSKLIHYELYGSAANLDKRSPANSLKSSPEQLLVVAASDVASTNLARELELAVVLNTHTFETPVETKDEATTVGVLLSVSESIPQIPQTPTIEVALPMADPVKPAVLHARHFVWIAPILLALGLIGAPNLKNNISASFSLLKTPSVTQTQPITTLKPETAFQNQESDWPGEPVLLDPRPTGYRQIIRH